MIRISTLARLAEDTIINAAGAVADGGAALAGDRDAAAGADRHPRDDC